MAAPKGTHGQSAFIAVRCTFPSRLSTSCQPFNRLRRFRMLETGTPQAFALASVLRRAPGAGTCVYLPVLFSAECMSCNSVVDRRRTLLRYLQTGGGSVEGVTSGAQLNEPGHYPGASRGPRDLEQAAGGPGLPTAGPSPRSGGGCCRAWCSARAAATAWPYTRADRSHPAGSCAVWTCPAGPGKLVVELAGRRVEDSLPGRQGRLLFGYVAINRPRRIGRDELMEMLWPEGTPARADAALRAVGSRLRSVIGPEILTGRGPLGLDLHVDAWIDLGVAEAAITRPSRPSSDHAGITPGCRRTSRSTSLDDRCWPGWTPPGSTNAEGISTGSDFGRLRPGLLRAWASEAQTSPTLRLQLASQLACPRSEKAPTCF